MLVSDHRCTGPSCEIDWLLDPNGPDDPAWLDRVKAEWDAAPLVIGRRPATREDGPDRPSISSSVQPNRCEMVSA